MVNFHTVHRFSYLELPPDLLNADEFRGIGTHHHQLMLRLVTGQSDRYVILAAVYLLTIFGLDYNEYLYVTYIILCFSVKFSASRSKVLIHF